MNYKKNLPKVSIIIHTYNQEKYIGQAIESALAQTYKNLEIIVSDDNSNDSTSEIIKSFLTDKRLKYFKNKENLGRVKNYHQSLYEYATGDFAINLDGDDFFTDKEYISKAIDLSEKHNLILVFAKQKVYFEKDKSFIEDKINSNLPTVMEGNKLFLDYCKGYS